MTSISDGLDPYCFRQKMEKMRSMKKEMDRGVFLSHQSRPFSIIDNMITVLFSICTLIWRVNNYVSRQGKGINRRNESTRIFILFCCLLYCINFLENFNCSL